MIIKMNHLLKLSVFLLLIQNSYGETKPLPELSEQAATPLDLAIVSSITGNLLPSSALLLGEVEPNSLSNIVFVSTALMTDKKYKDIILDYRNCTVKRTTYGLTGAVLKEEKIQLEPELFWGRIKWLSIYFSLYGNFPIFQEIDCEVLKALIEKGLKELKK